MKSGILEVQRRENMADSDPRLQPVLLGFFGEMRRRNPENGVLPADLPANRDLGGMPRNAANGPRIAANSSLTAPLPSG
jgi:hypothetical protein